MACKILCLSLFPLQEFAASVASSENWSNSDLVSSEFDSSTGKCESTDSKIETALEIVKVDLAQVKIEKEQVELVLKELKTKKESWENQCHQIEMENREQSSQLKADKEKADEQCRQLDNEKTELVKIIADLTEEKKALGLMVSDFKEKEALEVAEKQQKGSGAEQAIAALEQQLKAENEKCVNLQNELEMVTAEKSDYKRKVETFEVRIKEAEVRVNCAMRCRDGSGIRRTYTQ